MGSNLFETCEYYVGFIMLQQNHNDCFLKLNLRVKNNDSSRKPTKSCDSEAGLLQRLEKKHYINPGFPEGSQKLRVGLSGRGEGCTEEKFMLQMLTFPVQTKARHAYVSKKRKEEKRVMNKITD